MLYESKIELQRLSLLELALLIKEVTLLSVKIVVLWGEHAKKCANFSTAHKTQAVSR